MIHKKAISVRAKRLHNKVQANSHHSSNNFSYFLVFFLSPSSVKLYYRLSHIINFQQLQITPSKQNSVHLISRITFFSRDDIILSAIFVKEFNTEISWLKRITQKQKTTSQNQRYTNWNSGSLKTELLITKTLSAAADIKIANSAK